MKKIMIFLLILLLFACGGKKQTRQASTEYLYTTEAFKVVEQIRQAYQNKDNSGIRQYCSESAYREIVASIKPFDRAELEFTPVLAEMENDGYRLYVSWNGKWSYIGNETEERGLAIFLMKGNPPRVEKILRGNPFRYPD